MKDCEIGSDGLKIFASKLHYISKIQVLGLAGINIESR